jgi:hypothetical protein
MYIQDIELSKQAYQDYDKAPEAIRNKLTDVTRMVLELHDLPKGLQAHKQNKRLEKSKRPFDDGKDLYIGYLNQGKQGWRVLFTVSSNGVMLIERIVDHKLMETLVNVRV